MRRIFWKNYRFAGADLTWHVNWVSSEEVAVELFDYGVGINSTTAREAGVPSNHIATLNYRFDGRTGRFLEKR